VKVKKGLANDESQFGSFPVAVPDKRAFNNSVEVKREKEGWKLTRKLETLRRSSRKAWEIDQSL
jgi:hypothetical protein